MPARPIPPPIICSCNHENHYITNKLTQYISTLYYMQINIKLTYYIYPHSPKQIIAK